MAFEKDIRRFQAVSALPKVTSQWFREHQSLKHAASASDVVEVASHLARATTDDPAFNLFEDEERTVSTRNPLHEAFKSLHGTSDSMTHYENKLETLTGHMVKFNTDTHKFETKGKYFTIDNVLV